MVVMAALTLTVSCVCKKKLTSYATHCQNYEWLTAKMHGEVTIDSQPSTLNFSGSLRMRRDSTIWISATVMGIEAMRALVTSDSVFLVNRFEKTYLTEPIAVLTQMVHMPSMPPITTLQEFQALLLGNGNDEAVHLQWGPYVANIRYSDLQWDVPTTFPIKINDHYERMKP